MNKCFLLFSLLFLMPLLACNLTGGGSPTVVPNTNPGGIATQVTPNVVFVTPTLGNNPTLQVTTQPQATSFTQPTQLRVPTTANQQPTGSPKFSGLTFSTTAGGSALTTFPTGTTVVYARWDYSNVPVGTMMRRVWYRDGTVVVSREEPWSQNWGITGRLTHINLFDNDTGLTPGNYYVIISLPSHGVSIDGNFSIAGSTTGNTPGFTNLTASLTRDGSSNTTFPYGTKEVFIRWDFANIPLGSTMRREWYRDGVLFTTRDEAWNEHWSNTGRLTHISLYDYDSAYGLTPGTYRVVISLTNLPTVKIETTFTIQGNVGPTFSGLRFATSPTSPIQNAFPKATKRVYAIWEYQNIPVGAQVYRLWRKDGAVYAERTLAWDFNIYGTSGTVADVYIFDDINGLPSGSYIVEVSIVGQPATKLTGAFTISN